MAKVAGDSGLWLPPHVDKENNGKNGELDGFPSEFPYEFDSVAGSTETESSDEEDFFAGLTRRLSHESRKQQLTAPITASDKPEKTRVLAGSPQSTLSGIGSWSVSSDGTPSGSSRVPSPSTTPFGEANDPWDVIYAAAGQVARLRLNSEVSQSQFDFQNNRGLLGIPRSAAKNHTNTVPNLFSNQTLNHNPQVQQQHVRQEQAVKQQCGSVLGRQVVKPNWLVQQQQQLLVQNMGFESVKCTRPLSLPQSAWPSVQVQNQNQQLQYGGSGSRGVVPGGSAVKRGSGGTGVFLPRHYGNPSPSQPRKKTGCAPVVVPAKVVHALNLNINDFNATSQPRFSNAFAEEYDALLARRNALLMQQRLSLRREEAANYEVRLPQEWTYSLTD